MYSIIINKNGFYDDGYFIKTYVVQGEVYLACSRNGRDADKTKLYKSKKSAENFAEKIKKPFGLIDEQIEVVDYK